MSEDKIDNLRQAFDKAPEIAPDDAVKQASINAAMNAFKAAAKKDEKNRQGSVEPLRPTLTNEINVRRIRMNDLTRFSGIAASVCIVFLGAWLAKPYLMNSPGGEQATTEELDVQPRLITDSTSAASGAAVPAESDSIGRASSDDRVAQVEITPEAPVAYLEAESVEAAVVHAEPRAIALSEKAELAPAKARVAKLSSMPAGADLKRQIAPNFVPPTPIDADTARDKFESFEQADIKLTREHPVSTFSIDVDTASYSFVRRQLNRGARITPELVRLEEMINYFDYDYAVPAKKSEPFKPSISVLDSPWSAGKKLVHIAIKGHEIERVKKPKSNLVFLLDVSGSMRSEDKLPLVKQSMRLLLNTLQPEDKVSIAVYAGAAGVVLEPTSAKESTKILQALDQLQAGGSTAGAQGIHLAYKLLEENFDKEAVNRIFIATDGDFNVGVSDPDALKGLVEEKRKTGAFLSILGFGRGNYNDRLMQTLAQNGNGVAAYIDTLSEAQKVLVDEASSMLYPIAKDVKIQVEFNPATVAEYRLLGYETRALKREDFNNDKVDAGDIGAGHAVTAIYEITPTGSKAASVDKLRYSDSAGESADSLGSAEKAIHEYGFLKLRYKLPNEDTSRLMTKAIPRVATQLESPKADVNFSIAVAGFAQLLKGGKYLGTYNYDDVLNLGLKNKGLDPYGYRSEFVQLVRKAKLAPVLSR